VILYPGMFPLKPTPPTANDLQEYRKVYNCGLYTAKDVLVAKYNKDLTEWLVKMVETLVEKLSYD